MTVLVICPVQILRSLPEVIPCHVNPTSCASRELGGVVANIQSSRKRGWKPTRPRVTETPREPTINRLRRERPGHGCSDVTIPARIRESVEVSTSDGLHAVGIRWSPDGTPQVFLIPYDLASRLIGRSGRRLTRRIDPTHSKPKRRKPDNDENEARSCQVKRTTNRPGE